MQFRSAMTFANRLSPVATWWALPLLALALAGCDCFFGLDATVTDCDTHVPVSSAAVAVTVNSGFGGRSYVLDQAITTDEAGRFGIHLNEPCESKVTFTVSKDGYQPLTRVQNGARSISLDLCLTPASP
jgi:hypothetical protein